MVLGPHATQQTNDIFSQAPSAEEPSPPGVEDASLDSKFMVHAGTQTCQMSPNPPRCRSFGLPESAHTAEGPASAGHHNPAAAQQPAAPESLKPALPAQGLPSTAATQTRALAFSTKTHHSSRSQQHDRGPAGAEPGAPAQPAAGSAADANTVPAPFKQLQVHSHGSMPGSVTSAAPARSAPQPAMRVWSLVRCNSHQLDSMLALRQPHAKQQVSAAHISLGGSGYALLHLARLAISCLTCRWWCIQEEEQCKGLSKLCKKITRSWNKWSKKGGTADGQDKPHFIKHLTQGW